MGSLTHEVEVVNVGEELMQLPTSELKKRARSVWELIHVSDCYGTNDLRELTALEAELHKRGYALVEHERVVVEKTGV